MNSFSSRSYLLFLLHKSTLIYKDTDLFWLRNNNIRINTEFRDMNKVEGSGKSLFLATGFLFFLMKEYLFLSYFSNFFILMSQKVSFLDFSFFYLNVLININFSWLALILFNPLSSTRNTFKSFNPFNWV